MMFLQFGKKAINRLSCVNPMNQAMSTTKPSLCTSQRCGNPLIAVAQMTCSQNKDENFAVLENLVRKAASRGAQMVFLPEGCDYIAESKTKSIEMAEPLSGPTLGRYCQLAGSLRMWLSIGGMHIKDFNDDKINNTHLIIDDFGNVVSSYSKTHLFDVKIPERNINLQESTYVRRGDSISNPVATPCGSVSMAICYDMRFPEMSLLQRKAGAHILTFPSAFTITTGLAHWHTLLRARAIETQCYVVAAAQTGQHNSKRSSYGHALVIDPWGAVVAEVSEGVNIAFAEIDLNYLEKIRKEMPILHHRRKDLITIYNLSTYTQPRLTDILPFPCDYVSHQFGQTSVPGSCIFLKSRLSYACTNKNPFTSGHTLVIPEKPVVRYVDLNDGEVSDLSQAIVLTLRILIKEHNPASVQIAIQDGQLSGRTINHVHAHLVPIRETKENLMATGYELNTSNKWRENEDMAKEASILRHHLSQIDDWLISTDIPRNFELLDPSTKGLFQYSGFEILAKEVFLYSGFCFGFLPENPVLQGHVYICPCRLVPSLEDLTPAEVSDLFLSIQRVQKVLEEYFGRSSSTIFLSDNHNENGETLCAHIIPRSEGDFEVNDNIYKVLVEHQSNFAVSEEETACEDLLKHLKKSFNGV